MPEMKRGNPNAIKDLVVRLEGLKGANTKVGWFKDSAYPGPAGRPVAAVAAGNEFGIIDRSIPPRPFFRPTIAEKSPSEWPSDAALLYKRVLNGKMTGFDAIDTFGAKAQSDVAETITHVTQPPLSKITLGARKYRQEGKQVTGATIGEIARRLKEGTLDVSGVTDKPLEDSFTMLNTLTHVTEKNS